MPLVPQLPPHGTSIDRLGQHTRGLVDDVKDWVDLRIKLLQTEIENQVRGKLNELVVEHWTKVLPVVFWALGGFCLLLAAGYGVGAWLGHPAWGFLVEGILLGAAGTAIYKWYQREAPLNPRSPHHPGNPDKPHATNGGHQA